MKYAISLCCVKLSNPDYQAIRNRHYVPNHGCIGMQIHYLIKEADHTIGIISGASAVYAVAARDAFFGINKENRNAALPSIINNVVFRLEEHKPNMATQVLSLWRKHITFDWYERYGVKVAGFETFVVEEDYRKGSLYLADNWTMLGKTQGNTKTQHTHGCKGKAERVPTTVKLIFAKKTGVPLLTFYKSSWREKVWVPSYEKKGL